MHSSTTFLLLSVSVTSLVFGAFGYQDHESKLLETQRAMEAGCYSQEDSQEKQAITDKKHLWPNATLPYELAEFTSFESETILTAMKMISNRTCIKFVKRTTESNYLYIDSDQPGCFATAGMQGNGKQTVNLNKPGCFYYPGTAAHEFIHALGIFHEQSRTDRDDYVTIIEKNVIPKHLHNFKIEKNTETLGFPYDFNSIMHYVATAFSVDEKTKDTIVSKVPGKKVPRSTTLDLSENDVKKIKALYNCK